MQNCIDFIKLIMLFVYLLLIWIHISDCRKNVLFLVADDMRPELGAYFTKTYPPYQSLKMYTPNIDALASRSLLIERSYAQQSLCGPSRASLLTSRRPDTTRVYGCQQYFRQTGGNFTTLPQYFKNHGYKSVGMGKIFHFLRNPGGNDPISWSEPYFHGDDNFEDVDRSWEAIPDDRLKHKPLLDEQTADHAVQTLQRLAPDAKAGKQPFFMAVGFRRPHLPFVFPESYLQFYPSKSVKLPDNPYAPVNMPEIAWAVFARIRKYKDTKKYHITGEINGTFPKEKVLELRRAYHCCVTWVDAMLGRVLSELQRLNLSSNSIVSFIGDHGYNLGENGIWCKNTNFELATHAPMIIKIPGMTDNGIKTKQISELLDLFPTLVEAAGLPPLPPCPDNSSNIEVCREGKSLLPLIKNPNKSTSKAAFSESPRGSAIGYSMRTERYRYTEWPKWENQRNVDWEIIKGVELYDHMKDPEENVNRAFDPKYLDIRRKLSQVLREKFRRIKVKKTDYSVDKMPAVQKLSLEVPAVQKLSLKMPAVRKLSGQTIIWYTLFATTAMSCILYTIFRRVR